jgi:hypothetical protein
MRQTPFRTSLAVSMLLLLAQAASALAQGTAPATGSTPPTTPPPETAAPADAASGAVVDPAAPTDAAAPADAGPDMETAEDKSGIALEDEQTLHTEKEGVEKKVDSSDPYEDPDESYFFLGAMGGVIVLPSFLMNLFLDESPTIVNGAVGAEFTYRSDGFSIVVDLFYAGYHGTGGFRLPGEPKTDTEYVESSLSALMGTVSFLWSTQFSKYVALEYGVGIGAGVLLGDIRRSEAYPDGDDWKKCSGPDSGQGGDAGYCDGPPVADDERGAHYNVVAAKWSDGGDVPNIWPWLAIPTIGLRIKPIRQLQMRVNASAGIGFYLGASAAYGF